MAGIRVICEDTGWIDGIDAMFLLNSIAVQADINMILAAEVGFERQDHHNGASGQLCFEGWLLHP